MRTVCSFGRGSLIQRAGVPLCQDKALPGRLYCQAHLEAAMARVQTVLDPRPKRWPNYFAETSRRTVYR